jgi:hypothetical protein
LQDPDLREAAALLQQALNAETVEQEEALWTQVSWTAWWNQQQQQQEVTVATGGGGAA